MAFQALHILPAGPVRAQMHQHQHRQRVRVDSGTPLQHIIITFSGDMSRPPPKIAPVGGRWVGR